MNVLDESNNVVAVRMVLPDANLRTIKAIAATCKRRLLIPLEGCRTKDGGFGEPYNLKVLFAGKGEPVPFVTILGTQLPHDDCCALRELFEQVLEIAVARNTKVEDV